MAHHGWTRRKFLNRKENAILRLVFANTVIHKRAMLLIFYVEHTGCMLSIIMNPELVWIHHGWACRKMLKIKVLRRLENTFHKIDFW